MGIVGIIAIVAGGMALLGAVYGALRGFYRLTWIGWELAVVYCIDLLIPGGTNAAVSSLLLILFTVLPVVGEFFLRRAVFTERILPPGKRERIFDRSFGAVTAAVGVLMFFVAVGGLAIAVAGIFTEGGVEGIPDVIAGHALDFFLIALCLVTMRAGCRLGVLRGLNFLLTLLIAFGSFFGFFLIFSQVKGGVGFAEAVGGWFGPKGAAAAFLGCLLLTFFFSAIVVTGAMFLSKFLDGLIQKANSNMAVAIPDALVLGAVYLVVFILAVLGIQAAFSAVAGWNVLSFLSDPGGYMIDDVIAGFGQRLVDFAQSSPISAGFYLGNPFIG